MERRGQPPSTKPTLVALYDAIKLSKDKLVFIRFSPYGAIGLNWAVVQVDLDVTDRKKATKKGIYRCRWFGPHPDDVKYKSPRESRFWPIVRRLDNKVFSGNSTLFPLRRCTGCWRDVTTLGGTSWMSMLP